MHPLKGLLAALGNKESVQIGAGLATVLAGILALVTFATDVFDSGDGASQPAVTRETTGEFLRVQFGTEQDPATRLAIGDTVGPDEDLAACAGETLYAWVEHSFRNGDVINGRLSSRAGTLFSDTVPVDERAPNFWIGARVSNTGIHTLAVSLEGGDVRAEWSVNVTC